MPFIIVTHLYLTIIAITMKMRRSNTSSTDQKQICSVQPYGIVDQTTDPSGGDWSKLAPSAMTDFFTENGFV